MGGTYRHTYSDGDLRRLLSWCDGQVYRPFIT